MLWFLFLCRFIELISMSGLNFMWKAVLENVDIFLTVFLHCILHLHLICNNKLWKNMICFCVTAQKTRCMLSVNGNKNCRKKETLFPLWFFSSYLLCSIQIVPFHYIPSEVDDETEVLSSISFICSANFFLHADHFSLCFPPQTLFSPSIPLSVLSFFSA